MAARASVGRQSAVRVVDVESIPMLARAHVRAGGFSSRRLLDGREGSPANFSLQLGLTPDSYFSPRHRHNFDQVRYQLEGEYDFSSDGVMKPGTVAYFPEGTYYGPQSSSVRSLTLVLQFGGASGNGYMSPEQYDRAAAELRELGTFANAFNYPQVRLRSKSRVRYRLDATFLSKSRDSQAGNRRHAPGSRPVAQV